MIALGVNIALIQNNRVLLTLREDFRVWCLPGGHVEPGESIEAAAIREAREETGLDVAIMRMVGVYSTPNLLIGAQHNVLVVATLQGTAQEQPDAETLDVCWCSPDELPTPLMWWHRQRIADAAQGKSGVLCVQHVPWPFAPSLTRQELYQLRDESQLARTDFFLESFGQ